MKNYHSPVLAFSLSHNARALCDRERVRTGVELPKPHQRRVLARV